MSKSFKSAIRDRYKGRGNCWVKVPNDSPAYQKMIDVISSHESIVYLRHIEREGFGWIRFSKPSGTEENQICLFEVRYRGSKIDHPDSILSLSDSVSKTLPLLGNTPVKLEIEIEPFARSKKKEDIVVKKRNKNVSSDMLATGVDRLDSVDVKVEIISEKKLTKSSILELKEWEAFLKAEDLFEYSIEY